MSVKSDNQIVIKRCDIDKLRADLTFNEEDNVFELESMQVVENHDSKTYYEQYGQTFCFYVDTNVLSSIGSKDITIYWSNRGDEKWDVMSIFVEKYNITGCWNYSMMLEGAGFVQIINGEFQDAVEMEYDDPRNMLQWTRAN